MIIAKTRKWGNSLGIVIPKEEAESLRLRENEEVVVEIAKKDNPLKELFGFAKQNKITREEFLRTRKLLEPRL